MLTEQHPQLPTLQPGVLAQSRPQDLSGRVGLLEAQAEALRSQNVALMDAMRQWADTLNRDGVLHIYQAKILATHGLEFPATANPQADPNTLDDYKETFPWTPVDASGAALTLTVTTAKCVKIGSFVFVQADVTYPITADGSGVRIGGLPHLPAGFYAGSVLAGAGNPTACQAFDFGGDGLISFMDSAGALLVNSDLSGAVVRFGVGYFV